MPKKFRRFFSAFVLLLSSIMFAGCNPLSWKQQSGLQVLTHDVPATVYLDGKMLGSSPYINKELEPAQYNLEIRPTDTALASYQTKISLKNGLLTVVNWKPGNRPETSEGVTYEMEPLKDKTKSELSITTIPDGAVIRVDNQAKGFSPVLIDDITKGEHEYTIRLPSYADQKHKINVLEGYRMIVTIKMAKMEYTASTSANPTGSDTTATASATVPTDTPSAQTPSTAAASMAPVPTPAQPTSISGTQSSVEKPKVKVLSTRFFIRGKEVLRVRTSPTANAGELGFAPVGAEYVYLKETDNGWHKINFEGKEGWVSGQFVDLIQ